MKRQKQPSLHVAAAVLVEAHFEGIQLRERCTTISRATQKITGGREAGAQEPPFD